MPKPHTQGAKRTRDQYTVVLEGLRSDFKVFGEGLGSVHERVERMDKKLDSLHEQIQGLTVRIGLLEEKVEQLCEDMDFVKSEIRLIRRELKGKVDRDEFVLLEQRIESLEKRISVR